MRNDATNCEFNYHQQKNRHRTLKHKNLSTEYLSRMCTYIHNKNIAVNPIYNNKEENQHRNTTFGLSRRESFAHFSLSLSADRARLLKFSQHVTFALWFINWNVFSKRVSVISCENSLTLHLPLFFTLLKTKISRKFMGISKLIFFRLMCSVSLRNFINFSGWMSTERRGTIKGRIYWLFLCT